MMTDIIPMYLSLRGELWRNPNTLMYVRTYEVDDRDAESGLPRRVAAWARARGWDTKCVRNVAVYSLDGDTGAIYAYSPSQ